MNKWIKVEYRLPLNSEIVLCVKAGYMSEIPYVAIYDEGYFLNLEVPGSIVEPVTHWMPLPEPPKC